MVPVPSNARVIVPGCAFLVPGFLSPAFCAQVGPAIVSETFKQWFARRGFNESWSDVGHHMARFGDPGITYSYKGKSKPMHAFTPALNSVRTEVAITLGWSPNCVVVNSYAKGRGLYPHRDSTYIPQLGANPIIAAVSFGAARTFQLFPLVPGTNKRAKGATPIEVQLGDGDLFVMHGACDSSYHHGIPDEPHVTGSRISLTFRHHFS